MKTNRLTSSFRILAIALSIMGGSIYGYAKMTDDQVIEYIKTQTAAGKSEQQIGKELLARGVTPEQVNRLKARYEGGNSEMKSAPSQSVGAANAKRTRNATNEINEDNLTEVEIGAQEARVDITNGKGGRNVFGHSVFNNRALTFEPNENIATPQNYRLGPGDEVVIDIWGASEDQIRQTISPEGSIIVSQIGPIYLNGLTINEANNRVRDLLASKYAGVGEEETDIRLSLGQIRTIQVNVMGEVAVPGTYRLSPFSSVFHALYRSGGINEIGSMRNIQVLRNGRRLVEMDVYEYLFNGKETGNIRLQEGDVVIVPPYENLVHIEGNVKRPMFYEIKSGETLADLIGYAGGFTGEAYTDIVRLTRQNSRENELHNIERGEFESYILKDGDVVAVSTILDRYANRMEVKGAVFRPGIYALGGDVNTVRDLIKKSDGLLEDAYTTRVLLYREGPDLSLELIPLDLGAILDGSAPDMVLKRNDLLVIPSVHELIDRGELTIGGMVARPGTYPFAENTTLEDLVIQAGGLTQGASTARINVSRRLVDPNSLQQTNETAEIYTFGLKDGLIVDGEPGFILKPYDIVEVRRSPGYQVQRRVVVNGEVLFPGPYTLQNKNERLSEIVARTGGLTKAAYLKGAYLRRLLSDDERAARREVLRLAQQTQTDKDSVSLSMLDLNDWYTVGLDLEEALRNPGGESDLVLKENDHLYIPEYNNTVRIQGDVMYPNTVVYKEGAKLKYYIEQAGGYGSKARKNKAFIVYMNGMVARAKKNTPIEPGCHIIVPSKEEGKGVNWNAILSLTTATGTLATMAAAVANLIK